MVLEYIIKPAEMRVHHNNGIQRLYQFDNGYGASVVCHDGSYGNRQGLWELAVLDAVGNCIYYTPITDDVLGWLTDEEVEIKLKEISEL